MCLVNTLFCANFAEVTAFVASSAVSTPPLAISELPTALAEIILAVTALLAGKVSTGLLPIYAINYPYVCSSTDMIVSTELAVSETTFIMSPVSNTSF